MIRRSTVEAHDVREPQWSKPITVEAHTVEVHHGRWVQSGCASRLLILSIASLFLGHSNMIDSFLVRRRLVVWGFWACVFSSIARADESSASANGPVDELRIYHARPGTMDALVGRFRDHTGALFDKHGIESLGYWIDADAPETLIYVVRHQDPDAIEANWKSFGSDPEWKRVAKASGVGGLAKPIERTFMRKTDYSPSLPICTRAASASSGADESSSSDGGEVVFELRRYRTEPGKLPALDRRFADHTMGLFEKHGMENVIYWHPIDPGPMDANLIYIVRHDSRDAASQSWTAFSKDPQWKAAAAASGVGKLAERPTVNFMRATDFSKVQ